VPHCACAMSGYVASAAEVPRKPTEYVGLTRVRIGEAGVAWGRASALMPSPRDLDSSPRARARSSPSG
jgi:hypothetical protein